MKPLLAIAISGMLLTGCSKSVDSKSKSFTYPLASGNQWTYAHLVIMDYVDARKTDTLISSAISATVERVDTVLPGIFSYAISESPVDAVPPYPIPQVAYLNLPGGMYRSSSWGAPSLALPRQVPHATGIVCGDYWFPDVHTLVAALTDPASQTRGRGVASSGSFPLVLPYPQQTGQRWTYHDTSDTWVLRIDKEIQGRETVTTPAGSFDCWRIRWIYSAPLEGVEMVEFISAEGLIRRRVEARVLVVDYQYPYGDGDSADVVTTFDLTSFELH